VSELDFLGRMAETSRERVKIARARVSRGELLRRAGELPPAPRLRHDPASFDVIAEIKRRSPSEGALDDTDDTDGTDDTELARLRERALSYQRAGAAAISVLTEPSEFNGSLVHLQAASTVVDVPVLRKDFLVDPYQVAEARAHGAGGVLLIARMLSDEQLAEMVATTRELGMFALVEAFDGTDLERVVRLVDRLYGDGAHRDGVHRDARERDSLEPSLLAGVNCRDLGTLAVEPERFEALSGLLPSAVPAVAESGLHTADDAALVAGLGYDMALVGSALMRARDPAGLLSQLIERGRIARMPKVEDACESA